MSGISIWICRVNVPERVASVLENPGSVSLFSGWDPVIFTVNHRYLNLIWVPDPRVTSRESLPRGTGQHIWLLSVGFQL